MVMGEFSLEQSTVQSMNPTMMLSCSNFQLTETSKYPTGYTGFRPLKEEFDDRFERVPILGYSGWFRGKPGGRIGRPSYPQGSISTCDFDADDRNDAMMRSNMFTNSPHKMDRTSLESRSLKYELAKDESRRDGYTVNKILAEMKERIESRFTSLSSKNMYVKKLFLSYDPDATDCVSEYDFRLCLSQLGVMLPPAQFMTVMSRFDDGNGRLNWKEMLKIVCPMLKL